MPDEIAEDKGKRDGAAQCLGPGRHCFIGKGGDQPLNERALAHARIGKEDSAGFGRGEPGEERRRGILPIAQRGIECLRSEMRLRAGRRDKKLADGDGDILLALLAIALRNRQADVFVGGELVAKIGEIPMQHHPRVRHGTGGFRRFLFRRSGSRWLLLRGAQAFGGGLQVSRDNVLEVLRRLKTHGKHGTRSALFGLLEKLADAAKLLHIHIRRKVALATIQQHLRPPASAGLMQIIRGDKLGLRPRHLQLGEWIMIPAGNTEAMPQKDDHHIEGLDRIVFKNHALRFTHARGTGFPSSELDRTDHAFDVLASKAYSVALRRHIAGTADEDMQTIWRALAHGREVVI